MARFILRRLALSLITIIVLVAVVFLLTRVFPSDPARQLAGPFAPQERVDSLNEQFGLEDPLPVQFGRLLGDLVTFDLGESFSRPGVQVLDLVRSALWRSAKLVGLALFITVPLSILAGVVAARRKDTIIDRLIVTLGLASASIPEFVSGVVLQYFIGVKLGLLPAVTTVPADAGFFEELRYLTLPALAIVLVYFGYLARITRAGTITAYESDYVRTATMKGLSGPRVAFRHVLRNSLQPTVAVTGTQIGYLFGGLVGLEQVFNYPGLGRLILSAAEAPDYPLLQGGVVVVAVVFMLSTLAADLIISWMNPRARLAGNA